jgi:hypothetical protein
VRADLLAVGAWCAYCWHQTGDAFAFVSAKANWDEITIWRVFTDPRNLPSDLVPHRLLAFAAIGLVV